MHLRHNFTQPVRLDITTILRHWVFSSCGIALYLAETEKQSISHYCSKATDTNCFTIGILKVPFIQSGFEWLSSIFVIILGFTRDGSLFLFGGLIDNMDSFGYIFAFQVLPTIIFFSALTSVLFYYGILQKIVYFFALLMKKTLNLSGSESLAAVGNIFLWQTESPL